VDDRGRWLDGFSVTQDWISFIYHYYLYIIERISLPSLTKHKKLSQVKPNWSYISFAATSVRFKWWIYSDGQLINDLFTVDLSKKNWVARELRLRALCCVGVCGICIGLILKWVCYFLSKALCIIIFFQIQGCPKVADALKKTNEKSVLRYQISNKFQRSLKRFVSVFFQLLYL